MSQAGIIDASVIPPPPGSVTDLQGQDGVTVPPNGSGIIFVHGATVAAGSTPFTTTGNAGTSTETWNIQLSQAIAGTDATKVGLAAFNSSNFSVDANGFVSLVGGTTPVESFAMQTGTSPVVPTVGGLVTFNGAVVAAGSNPVRTDGTGANTMALEVQISQAIAATDATKVGLSAFNSVQFNVDANGFVSLIGGGSAIEKVNLQTGTTPIVPAGGAITFNGATVAAGTNPVRTDGTGANTMALEVQISQAIAATDATKIGLAAFNSANFTVDANGFVTSLGTGFVWIDQGTSITLAKNTGYFVTAATTQTLPASPSQGDTVKIICDTASTVVVTANTGQTIRQGTVTSSSGGTFTNTARGDALDLFYRASTTQWIALNGQGVWVAA